MPGESQLWSLMARHLPENMMAERIECRHPAGHPDVLWSLDGHGYLELKDTKAELRPEQRIIGQKWRRAGLNVLAVARKRDMIYVCDPLIVPLDCRLPLDLARTISGGQSPIVVMPMPTKKAEWATFWDYVRSYK